MMTESWMKMSRQATGDGWRATMGSLWVPFYFIFFSVSTTSPKVAWASWVVASKQRLQKERTLGAPLVITSQRLVVTKSRSSRERYTGIAASSASRKVHVFHSMTVRGVSSQLSLSLPISFPVAFFAARVPWPILWCTLTFSEEGERKDMNGLKRQSNQRDLWLVLKRSMRIH